MPQNDVTATLSAKRSSLALNSRMLQPTKGLDQSRPDKNGLDNVIAFAMTLSLWKIHFPKLRLFMSNGLIYILNNVPFRWQAEKRKWG